MKRFIVLAAATGFSVGGLLGAEFTMRSYKKLRVTERQLAYRRGVAEGKRQARRDRAWTSR